MKNPHTVPKKKTKSSANRCQEGFSLIEILITMLIMGFILLLINVVLISLIRVAYTTDTRMKVRQEVEFSLEVMNRNIRSARPETITLWTYDGSSFSPCSSQCNAISLTLADTADDNNVVFILDDSQKVIRIYWAELSGSPAAIDPPNAEYLNLTSSQDLTIKDLSIDMFVDADSGMTSVQVTITADSKNKRSGMSEPLVIDYTRQALIVAKKEAL